MRETVKTEVCSMPSEVGLGQEVFLNLATPVTKSDFASLYFLNEINAKRKNTQLRPNKISGGR